MAGSRLITALIAGTLVLANPTPAQATWPVRDDAAIVKLIEQVKQAKKDFANQVEQLVELKKQLSFLTEIRDFINEVYDTIGDLATIVLPITSLDSVTAQLVRDTVCLMPDGLDWGIDFDDLNLFDICNLSSEYRRALFVDQDAISGSTVAEQNAAREEVVRRRDALLADVVSRSLAQGDVQIRQADDINEAATQLQSEANRAKTMQDRLAVSVQVQIAQLRADANRNQILAQMLKLHGAIALKAGLSPDDIPSEEDEESE